MEKLGPHRIGCDLGILNPALGEDAGAGLPCYQALHAEPFSSDHHIDGQVRAGTVRSLPVHLEPQAGVLSKVELYDIG